MGAYVDWVSKKPHFRDVGIALYGSQSHLAGLMLGCEEEIALRMQTYSHTTAIIGDLLDGGLAATIFVCGQVNSRRAEGKVHALTVTSKDRIPNWPAVKTFTEQDMPMDVNGWIGWFVSANTSDPTISDLFNNNSPYAADPGLSGIAKALSAYSGFSFTRANSNNTSLMKMVIPVSS